LIGTVAQKIRAVKRDLGVEVAADSIFNWREAAPEDPGGDGKNDRGKPYPKEFRAEDFETATAEESCYADRGNANGSPRKKIPLIIERGKEGHSQSAVRHSVKETVACGRQEEVNPQGEPAEWGHGSPESYEHRRARQESGEKKGVRESAVAPEVAITDPEAKPNDVEVWDNRTDCPGYPDPIWRAVTIETSSDANGSHRVREY